jgi:cellulose-binding protein
MRHVLFLLLALAVSAIAVERPRLCVLTDIGGDPDDQQSMVRLMVYANEFEIEGLIATAAGTPGELKQAVTRPELIREIVAAYGQVRGKLMRHAEGWPTEQELAARIKTGNPRRGREHIGEGHDTEGSRWLIERIDAGKPGHPLNIAIWGGQTDLAQALWQIKHSRDAAGFADFAKRFRVFDIDDQDRIADWMREEFPGMNYILAKALPGHDRREGTYRGIYLGGDETLTSREWIEKNIRSRGPLGALYPVKTWTAPNPHGCMKEGDTPSWFFFLPRGGNDPADPGKPGWGGQYQKSTGGWYRDIPGTDPREAVYRWRPAFQADFARRMSWCVE